MSTQLANTPALALHLFRAGTNFRYQGRRVLKMYEYSISPARIDGRDNEDDDLAVELEGDCCLTPCRAEDLIVA